MIKNHWGLADDADASGLQQRPHRMDPNGTRGRLVCLSRHGYDTFIFETHVEIFIYILSRVPPPEWRKQWNGTSGKFLCLKIILTWSYLPPAITFGVAASLVFHSYYPDLPTPRPWNRKIWQPVSRSAIIIIIFKIHIIFDQSFVVICINVLYNI